MCAIIVRNQKFKVVTTGDGPYAYKGDQWISFDNTNSVQSKAEWIRKEGYGGAAVWSIDMDDYNNLCCREEYPLLRTVARAFAMRSDPAPTGVNCRRPSPPSTPPPLETTTGFASGENNIFVSSLLSNVVQVFH